MFTFQKKCFYLALAAVALPLAACSKETDTASAAAADAPASGEQAELHSATAGRVVAIDVGDQGFKPSKIEVKKGERTTLRFVRSSDKTCAKKVVFPDIKLEKELPLNQPVDVVVPTDKSRALVFQCGMGMYKSSVLIN